MAIDVHYFNDSVLDCVDAPALLATPLERCPEEPHASQECVLVEDLAPIVSKWLEREIASAAQAGGGGAYPSIGVRAILCERSGIPERRLFAILQGEQASVSLDTADRLLAAIDVAMWEVDVFLTTEVRAAAAEQTQMMRTIAKTTGHFIPEGTARKEIPQIRRRMNKRGA